MNNNKEMKEMAEMNKAFDDFNKATADLAFLKGLGIVEDSDGTWVSGWFDDDEGNSIKDRD